MRRLRTRSCRRLLLLCYARIRAPFRRAPHGVTLIGRLVDEGTIGRVGVAMEQALGAVGERPAGM